MEEACDKHPESTENGDLSETERIFTEIFRTRSWGNLESASGPGSTRERASQFLNELLDSLRRLGVRSLLDAPCGDFNWAAPIADEVEEYIGVMGSN